MMFHYSSTCIYWWFKYQICFDRFGPGSISVLNNSIQHHTPHGREYLLDSIRDLLVPLRSFTQKKNEETGGEHESGSPAWWGNNPRDASFQWGEVVNEDLELGLVAVVSRYTFEGSWLVHLKIQPPKGKGDEPNLEIINFRVKCGKLGGRTVYSFWKEVLRSIWSLEICENNGTRVEAFQKKTFKPFSIFCQKSCDRGLVLSWTFVLKALKITLKSKPKRMATPGASRDQKSPKCIWCFLSELPILNTCWQHCGPPPQKNSAKQLPRKSKWPTDMFFTKPYRINIHNAWYRCIYIYPHFVCCKNQHTKTIPLDPQSIRDFPGQTPLNLPPEGHESRDLLGNLCVVCQSCRLYAWEGGGEGGVKRPWFLLEGWGGDNDETKGRPTRETIIRCFFLTQLIINHLKWQFGMETTCFYQGLECILSTMCRCFIFYMVFTMYIILQQHLL